MHYCSIQIKYMTFNISKLNGALLNLQKQILSVVLNIKLKDSVEELENDPGLIWNNIIKREFTSKQRVWLKYKIDHVMFLKTSCKDINLRSIHLVLFKIVKITALHIALSFRSVRSLHSVVINLRKLIFFFKCHVLCLSVWMKLCQKKHYNFLYQLNNMCKLSKYDSIIGLL